MRATPWLFIAVLYSLARAQLASAQTNGDYCIEILRQGVYDFYLEKRSDTSLSDIRAAVLEQLCKDSSSTSGGGGNVGIGPISVGGQYSSSESEAMCSLMSKQNSDLIAQTSNLLRDVRKINASALGAFNQCIALGGRGLEAIHSTISADVFSLSLRHANPGSSVRLQNLNMSVPRAFRCEGTLAGMARSGGVIDHKAVNMVCTRQIKRSPTGELLEPAPSTTITVASDQGLLRYDFPALKPPPRRTEAPAPIGAILAFAGGEVPEGWLVCDGKQYAAAEYRELAALLGSVGADGKETFAVPDLRGRFLRGVNDGITGPGRDPEARVVGAFQDWATARPRSSAFTTDRGGAHNHGGHRTARVDDDQANTIHEGTDRTPGEINVRVPGPPIPSEPAHGHTIENGGDVETRPANIAVRFMIHAGVPVREADGVALAR